MEIISIKDEDIRIDLDSSIRDILPGALTKVSSLAGLPLFTTVFEIVTSFLPGQRLERAIDFIRVLDAKIQYIEKFKLADSLNRAQVAELVDISITQAANTIGEARRKLIADALLNGLSIEEIHFENKKRLMQIFGSLNTIEIILLLEGSLWSTEEEDFDKFHEPLWESIKADYDADVLEYAGETVFSEYHENLRRVGLTKDHNTPTRLGELLLHFLGLAREQREPNDFNGSWKGLGSDLAFGPAGLGQNRDSD